MTVQNPLVRLHQQFLEIRPDLEQVFASDSAAMQRVEETAEKISEDAHLGKLSTLVFGHYNAGKSTFINALLGKEAAAMGDIPLTGAITSYEWNGHVLFDSPGIDAPIEHEQLTDDFIRTKCNAVVFVISTGGAIEEASTWQRLCQFVSEKKAVIIVVNDKAGLDLNGEEFLRIRNTVYSNIQEAARKLGLSDPLDQISVLHVKAKTALKARVENKSRLLEMSGILEAEAVLMRFLSASTEKILASNSERARALANEAIAKLAARSGSEASVKLAACRSKVEQERTRLESSLIESVRTLAAQEIGGMHATVANIDRANGQSVSELLSVAMERSQSRLLNGVERQLRTELDRTDLVIREAAHLLAQQVKKGEVDVDDVRLTAAEFAQRADASSGGDGFVSATLEKMKGMPIDKMTESGVREALKFGKDILPKLFKGIGPKTMGKWAAAAGKLAGPLLIVGQIGWDLFQAQKQEDEEREQHRQFVQGVMGVVHQAFNDAVGQYELMFKNMSKAVLDPVLEALDERSIALQTQSLQQREIQERLSTWSRELDK